MPWLIGILGGLVSGIWGVVGHVGKLVFLIFSALWVPLTITISILVGVFVFIPDGLSWLGSNASAAWAVLTNAKSAAAAAKLAGWPSELAAAMSWVNYHVPFVELFQAAAGLFTLWVFCTVFRVVKSWLPVIGT